MLLIVIGNEHAVVGLFLLDFFFEFCLKLEDNLISLLFALEIALGVLAQLSSIVFLFTLFCSSLIL